MVYMLNVTCVTVGGCESVCQCDVHNMYEEYKSWIRALKCALSNSGIGLIIMISCQHE